MFLKLKGILKKPIVSSNFFQEKKIFNRLGTSWFYGYTSKKYTKQNAGVILLWRWLAQAINQLKMIKTRTTTARKAVLTTMILKTERRIKTVQCWRTICKPETVAIFLTKCKLAGSRNYDIYKKANMIILLISNHNNNSNWLNISFS